MLTKEDLNAIENIVGRRFDKVDERFDRMDEKFEQIDGRLERMDEKFDRMDEKFEQIDGRFEQMDERFDTVDRNTDLLNWKIDREIRESELRMSEMMDRKLEPLQKEIHMIRVDLLENNVIPRLNNIEQCYLSTYDRYAANADKMEAMSDDISVLKVVVSNHSDQLKRLPCNA